MNGDRPISHVENQFRGMIKRRVPGLRDEAPPSTCKVFKMVNGKKVLVREE